jgi:hypothetical protein
MYANRYKITAVRRVDEHLFTLCRLFQWIGQDMGYQ